MRANTHTCQALVQQNAVVRARIVSVRTAGRRVLRVREASLDMHANGGHTQVVGGEAGAAGCGHTPVSFLA